MVLCFRYWLVIFHCLCHILLRVFQEDFKGHPWLIFTLLKLHLPVGSGVVTLSPAVAVGAGQAQYCISPLAVTEIPQNSPGGLVRTTPKKTKRQTNPKATGLALGLQTLILQVKGGQCTSLTCSAHHSNVVGQQVFRNIHLNLF